VKDGLNRVTVAELMLSAEFPALVEGNARESALPEMPPPYPKLERYQPLESTGVLATFVWASGGRIVGYLLVLTCVVPHYERPMAVIESIFIDTAHRKGGAGLAFLQAAEERARHQGCQHVLASAPSGGRLADVLPRRGYREANRVFVKRASDG
jgi:GNAT superfamily N-acetyltransferase